MCIMKNSFFLLFLSIFLLLPNCKPAEETNQNLEVSPDQSEDSDRSSRRSRSKRDRDKSDKQAEENPSEDENSDSPSDQVPGATPEIVTENTQTAPVTRPNREPSSTVDENPQPNINIDVSIQVNSEPEEERFVVWQCSKEDKFLLYVLDNAPLGTHLHGGTAKFFACELYQVINEESTSILHAHNIKSHCSNKLEKKLQENENEGFSCETVEAEVEIIEAEETG